MSQLAEKMGIKKESLSRAINGNPTLETLERIANALEVDVPELFAPHLLPAGIIWSNPHKRYQLQYK